MKYTILFPIVIALSLASYGQNGGIGTISNIEQPKIKFPTNMDGTGAGRDNRSFNNDVSLAQDVLIPSLSNASIGPAGNNNVSLPVELISLTAEPIDNSYIRLSWATATEQNNKGFDVMRSTDGVDFTRIGWVDGHGTASVQNNYNYEDKTIQTNTTYYYRLDQVDADGRSTPTYIVSSSIIDDHAVTVSGSMPNPTTGQVRLAVSTTAESGQISIRIYDILGKLVMSNDNNQTTFGTYTFDFDMSSCPDATYSAVIRVGDNTYCRRIVLVK